MPRSGVPLMEWLGLWGKSEKGINRTCHGAPAAAGAGVDRLRTPLLQVRRVARSALFFGEGVSPMMVSFAQNHEDVLLARAFAEVGQGFYVDVGANDPSADSVTRHFYDRG